MIDRVSAALAALTILLALCAIPLATRALADDPARGPDHSYELSVLLLAGVDHDPRWDEAEQAWRDPASRMVWWLPSPGWVHADGLGHYWFDGEWRYRDGTPYLLPPPLWSDHLDVVEMTIALRMAGWAEWEIPSALSVACGIGNYRWPSGESRCNRFATNGQYLGLFQLAPFHFPNCGEDIGLWADPVVNSRTALCLYRSSGWNPWEVKP